jgi:hypothetical protein
VSQDREGYALCAGLALGLLMLGRGRSCAGLADLKLEERLVGGVETSVDADPHTPTHAHTITNPKSQTLKMLNPALSKAAAARGWQT